MNLEDILQARDRIRGHVVETPCPFSEALSEAAGMRIYCKLDYLQRTGSFKERGARNALELLAEDQRRRGVTAASAGNHALGLAYHAQQLRIPCTVVMPRFAPLTKVTNCRKLGANVLLHGNSIAEARIRADELVAAKGVTYINGYDDLAIIAGQGTLALEILAQVPELQAIIVPIGGGGLIAGTAVAIKSQRPDVQIIGVEPDAAASFSAAIKAGKPVPFKTRATLADGLAVPEVGQNAFSIATPLVDKIVTVGEAEIARAILRLAELEKSVVEGAGASSLSACLAGMVPELAGKNVVLPLCGGNIDMSTLGKVIERGLASEGRLFRFTTTISDRPGGLARFAEVIAEEGASFLDISHDRAFADQDISTVSVQCVVETRDREHIQSIRRRCEAEGFHLA